MNTSMPLSLRAVELLSSLPKEKGNDFVFIGTQKAAGLSNMSMATVIKRMGRDNVTVHGFRSTFRDWAAETTSFPNHVIEMALAHTIGDKVEAAYRRGDLFDKRRKLMEAWTKFCTTKPADTASNVTPIRVRRA
jgi:integrase